jgi:SAM-dependent methyltransferase
MAGSAGYVMGGERAELRRLLGQCEELREEAVWLLDQLCPQPGWRVIDLGCGPLGILNLLAERVGPAGEVVGLEREARFVAMARAELDQRGLHRVRVIEGDAIATGLPRGAYDLVHERLVLLQQPDPLPMLHEMVELARPGGLVAIEDIDVASWLCHPPHPAWEALREAFETLVAHAGMDVHLGRRLPERLRAVGLEDVRAEVHTGVCPVGDPRRMHLLSLIEPVRGKIVEAGLLTEAELVALVGEATEHLAQPATLVVRQLHCQAWGRKRAETTVLAEELTAGRRGAR